MMQYGDIPDARSMKTVSNIHKINRCLRKSGEIREAIVNEIANAAKFGYTHIKFTAHNLAMAEPMYELFNDYNNYSYILGEFQHKGYKVITTKESYALLGGEPKCKSIFISWIDENETKGDE